MIRSKPFLAHRSSKDKMPCSPLSQVLSKTDIWPLIIFSTVMKSTCDTVESSRKEAAFALLPDVYFTGTSGPHVFTFAARVGCMDESISFPPFHLSSLLNGKEWRLEYISFPSGSVWQANARNRPWFRGERSSYAP